DYPRFAEPLRDRVRWRAGELAAAAGHTIEHIANSHIRKEEVVAKVLAERGDHPGLVCVSLNLIRQSLLGYLLRRHPEGRGPGSPFRRGSRGAGRGSHPRVGTATRPPAPGTETTTMTQEQKIIRAKGRFARAGQAARQCQPSLQDDGLP